MTKGGGTVWKASEVEVGQIPANKGTGGSGQWGGRVVGGAVERVGGGVMWGNGR